MPIDHYRVAINQWGSSFPSIHRVWLFGSRVKGNEKPDSDLDVAVEIDPHALRGEQPFVYWMFESPDMKTALASLIDVTPHVQQYHVTEPEVFSAVKDHGVLVYKKQMRKKQ